MLLALIVATDFAMQHRMHDSIAKVIREPRMATSKWEVDSLSWPDFRNITEVMEESGYKEPYDRTF